MLYVLLRRLFDLSTTILKDSYPGRLSDKHSLPEDVKSLLQKICGFFATKMA